MLKIYRIVDNTNGNIYIGKTKKKYLCQRLAQHKYDYKNNKPCMSRDIIKNGDYRMELIEETDDETRERYWIENTECINKVVPNRNRKEYYDDNKDAIIKKSKKYYENNKEKINNTRKYKYIYNLLKIDPNLFF